MMLYNKHNRNACLLTTYKEYLSVWLLHNFDGKLFQILQRKLALLQGSRGCTLMKFFERTFKLTITRKRKNAIIVEGFI